MVVKLKVPKIEEIPARCRDKMVGLLKLQCEPRFWLRVDIQLSLLRSDSQGAWCLAGMGVMRMNPNKYRVCYKG